jgi:hypothetical protein
MNTSRMITDNKRNAMDISRKAIEHYRNSIATISEETTAVSQPKGLKH